MSDFYRPGPPFIEPETAPDRVIIDVWTVPFSRRLEHSRHLLRVDRGLDDAETLAGADAAACSAMMMPNEEGLCIVAYDGDTGERLGIPSIRDDDGRLL